MTRGRTSVTEHSLLEEKQTCNRKLNKVEQNDKNKNVLSVFFRKLGGCFYVTTS